MIFSSFDYFIFFISFLLVIMLVKSNTVKKSILLLSSYLFYAYWDYRFVFLMLIMSLFNYYFGLKIERVTNKKSWLILSIAFNLIILGFFKYYNFFVESFNAAFICLDISLSHLNIILPVGISFITFEVMSYVIDIYRGTNKSAKHFGDLAMLVAFFPHLIAGPILKPSQFLPQLDNEIVIKKNNLEIGAQLFVLGLVKKVLIADRLALFVDPVFKDPYIYSSITIWLAVIAYALQIYCDFSGYTDMAIGSAKCFGFDIPQNFNMPYISRSVTEFWRRWHISLSTWLRDYLYLPLGGNRREGLRKYCNLLIVMLLGGLWHGANWNFVIWGGLHGMALAIHKMYLKYFGEPRNASWMYDIFCWFFTFLFVCVSWVFFRCSTLISSLYIIQKMFYITPSSGINWYASSLLISIPFIIICHFARLKNRDYYFSLTSFTGLLILSFTLLGLIFLVPLKSSPFIYFQF